MLNIEGDKMARITKSVEERRQEIIDAAKELFFENGFDKTQVADISKKLNVAQGLVYHYFKSKTEILYAVIDELSEERLQVTKEALSENEGSAIDCLRMLLLSNLEMKKYEKLFESIMRDTSIVEYCSKKMTVSMTPLLLMLIERGNLDGSWNCEYANETTAFILQGISGILGHSPPNQDEQQKKKACTNILYRILGIQHPSENG